MVCEKPTAVAEEGMSGMLLQEGFGKQDIVRSAHIRRGLCNRLDVDVVSRGGIMDDWSKPNVNTARTDVIDAIRESYVIGSKFRNEFHPLARPFEYKPLLPSPTSFSTFN